MILVSAILFSILIFIVILFQAALALGAPWGEYAMGGKFPGKFPLQMRVACIFQIVILIFLGLIVLSKVELLLSSWSSFAKVAIWFVVAFSAVSTVLNTITKSVPERRIWAPVSVLLLLTSLITAVS